jgi:hypothetical protein
MKPNLKASPSLFTHAKNARSLIHVINTWVWGQIWFQEKDRQLSEGSTPVIFISMMRICILRHKWGSQSTGKDEPHTVMRANPLLIKPPPPGCIFSSYICRSAYRRGGVYRAQSLLISFR